MNQENIDTLPTDELLLSMIQRGDQRAIAMLLDRYSSKVFAVAYRILGQHACAEDVRQDLFLQLFLKPESFIAVRGNVGSWLAACARNRSIDLIRKTRYMESIHDLDYPSLTNFERDSERRFALSKLSPFIDELPPRQKELLHMSFFLGFSHGEIAKETGRPLGTVKTMIRGALDHLRSRVAA